jgi:hypothetical protein
MRIRRPRSLTGWKIVFATIIGTVGGVYVWKPLLKEELSKRIDEEKSDVK